MKIDREHVLLKLRQQRERIEREYGLRIVGSVARGDATEEGDVDIIVDVTGRPTLFSLSRAERELAETLGMGVPVELVLREGMHSASREFLERDLVTL